MDNAREKLVELIRGGRMVREGIVELLADYLLANGVTFHGMAELVLDYPLGRDLYTLTPKWRCSHCGFGIEDRSRPPRRFDFLQFCPKCGFMFLPQKEVNDGEYLDAGDS